MRFSLVLLATLLVSSPSADAAPSARSQKTKTTKAQRTKVKAAAREKGRRPSKGTVVRLGTKTQNGVAKSAPLASFRAEIRTQMTKGGLRVPQLKLRAKKVKDMKYLRSAISEKHVQKIQSVVEELQASSPNELIVFRGQEKLTKKVQSQAMQELPLKAAIRELKAATQAESKEAAETISSIADKPYPTKYEQGHAEHLGKATGLELLAIKSQNKFASRFLVSTTRDLSIAFGDFYMAPAVRYVYIMQVPRDHVVNLHGLVAERAKTMNLPKAGNQREKELAIPLQATEYVRAVFDTKTGKLTKVAR